MYALAVLVDGRAVPKGAQDYFAARFTLPPGALEELAHLPYSKQAVPTSVTALPEPSASIIDAAAESFAKVRLPVADGGSR